MKRAKRKTGRKRFKDMSIISRIFIANVCIILFPTILLIALSPTLFSASALYFGFSNVTSNTYSSVNQIQWNFAINNIYENVTKDDGAELKKYLNPIEKIGYEFLITKNGEIYYLSENSSVDGIEESAKNIARTSLENEMAYYGKNGLLINRIYENNGDEYKISVISKDYTMSENDTSIKHQISVITGKSIVGVVIIAAIFATAMLIITSITANSINKPLTELKISAEEIGSGNLYHRVNYESKNELGQTAEAFDLMRRRLLESEETDKERERAQKEMIAGVAHDLRTPLTSIKGYVEGLLDNIANTPEKRERYLKTIYSSTLDMEKLLDDLLTYSKLNLNTIVLNKKKINIYEYMKDCAEDLENKLHDQNFDFKFNAYCDDNVTVMLDPDNFARVIRNVVSNSLKYKQGDKKGVLTFTLTQYTRTVLIEVEDNGIGVDSDELIHIFDSFYRADKARTRTESAANNSSGLGLSVCKQIVTLHNGSIWATSEKGKGLTIHISLPTEKENK